jgi:hypothetical protein
MNQQSLKAEDAKNKEVEQLQKQIDELKKPAATSTATATTASATDWKTYRNTDYGFQLTFPEAWKGYKLWEQTVEGGGTKTWYVELPTTDTNYAKADATHEAGYSSLFALSAYTKAQWDADQAQEGPKSTLLKTIGQYTFGYSYAQAGPTDIPAARRAEIQSILATFKAN